MKKPEICAVVINNAPETITQEVSLLADLFEVRIDLIGAGWQQLAMRLSKPWIACNRTAAEGGQWRGTEARRIEPLLQATELGAGIVDIELSTGNLENIVKIVKRKTKLLLSYHDLEKTPFL